MFSLTGLVAATFTPMHADGSLHLAQTGPVAERLIAQGVAALFVCGTTGEAASLTTAERKAVLETYIAAAAGRVPVVAHVGHTSIADARDLAAHAQAIGAAAVCALPPFYFRPPTVESLVDCMRDIADAAPALPFYYYHIPGLSGVVLDMVAFLQQAGERIPTLAGIKYTAPTVFEFQACAAFDDGRFDLLFGVDEMLIAGLAAGARGAVGSTYNLAPRLYRELMAHFAAGRYRQAQQLQLLSAQMVRAAIKHRPLPALKSMMKLAGTDCGPTRLPLAAMSAAECDELERDLRSLGFLEWMR
jgi:N-acetylneuraminate lyase